MIYTCQVIEDDGRKVICGAKHKTLAAAERCLRSGAMAPGMFREYEGQILEVEGRKIVKRFASTLKRSQRGKTVSLSAKWVEIPSAPTAAPAAPAPTSPTTPPDEE